MERSIAEWEKIFGTLDATNCGPEDAIANRILGDLVGYRTNSQHRQADARQLANALQAYFNVCRDCGLEVLRVKI